MPSGGRLAGRSLVGGGAVVVAQQEHGRVVVEGAPHVPEEVGSQGVEGGPRFAGPEQRRPLVQGVEAAVAVPGLRHPVGVQEESAAGREGHLEGLGGVRRLVVQAERRSVRGRLGEGRGTVGPDDQGRRVSEGEQGDAVLRTDLGQDRGHELLPVPLAPDGPLQTGADRRQVGRVVRRLPEGAQDGGRRLHRLQALALDVPDDDPDTAR